MAQEKVRLDKLMVSSHLVETRERARALILSGRVDVDGHRILKPGTGVDPHASVTLLQPDHPYVSRGGVKLEGALRVFQVSPQGKVALDVGASTGGFTHCLLLHGARRVYAVDVGYGQFAWSLRQDPRVRLFERTNIRHLGPGKITEEVDLAVVDVAFISLKKVLPCVLLLLSPVAELLCLVKPQFEAGKGNVGKGGVVRDTGKIQAILDGMHAFVRSEGLHLMGTAESVLRGPKGNREFFIHLQRNVLE